LGEAKADAAIAAGDQRRAPCQVESGVGQVDLLLTYSG
jgi:hypothetical protein